MTNSQCSKRAILLLLLLGDTPSAIRAWSTNTTPSFSSCCRCRRHSRLPSSSSSFSTSSLLFPRRSCTYNRRHERQGSGKRRPESSSPLTTLRGGGGSSSSFFFNDETTTIRRRRDERHTTARCPPASSSVPLPFSMLEDATAANNEYPLKCKDVQTALLAVLAGCRAAHIVQPHDYDDPIGMTKDDASPVTIGDYAAQAVVLHILNTTTFGTASNNDDAYIAEEGSGALLGIIQRQRQQKHSSSSSSSTFSSTHSRKENSVIESILNVTNRATAGLPIEAGPSTTTTTTNEKSIPTVESLLDIIDHRGRGDDGDVDGGSRKRRVWCLDPIDGTKGFLRGRIAGGQYCVALALMEDGIPIIGILGCPNMPTNTYTSSSTSTSTSISRIPQYGHWSEDEIMQFDKAEEDNRKNEMHDDDDDDRSFALFSSMPKRGCVFLAVRGYGCYEVSLHELEKRYLGNKRKRNIPSDSNPSDKKEMEESLLWTRLQVTTPTPKNNDTNAQPNNVPNNVVSNGKFCLGIERTFSDPDGIVLQMACDIQGPTALTTLDLNDNNVDIVNSVRFDGQGKYGLLARGRDAQYFVRLPRSGYVDWVWDVAAGYVVLTEAGGCVTDVNGKDIDFTNIGNNYGRGGEQDNVDVEEEEQRKRTAAKLPDHLRGIVGSSGGVYHQALLDAYARVQAKMTQRYETNK